MLFKKDYQDLMKDFEKSRIEKLQEEREIVQQKTFTKWCNSFLSKVKKKFFLMVCFDQGLLNEGDYGLYIYI